MAQGWMVKTTGAMYADGFICTVFFSGYRGRATAVQPSKIRRVYTGFLQRESAAQLRLAPFLHLCLFRSRLEKAQTAAAATRSALEAYKGSSKAYLALW